MLRPLFVICLVLLLPVSIFAGEIHVRIREQGKICLSSARIHGTLGTPPIGTSQREKVPIGRFRRFREFRGSGHRISKIEMHMSDCPFANVGINNPLKLDYISLMSVDKDDKLTDKILLHTALGGQFMNSEIVFGNATAPYDKPKVWNANDKLKVVLRYRTTSLNGDNNNDFYGFNPNLMFWNKTTSTDPLPSDLPITYDKIKISDFQDDTIVYFESTTGNDQLPCYEPSRWVANHGIYVVEPDQIKFNNMYYDPSVLQLGNKFT
ncbi:hypothetical protein WR25_23931 [Diploscapter pachys]|uniref:Uncharacterized protein n=1 Tax=Diploscapter pachys TaxID=2018661 RepID=A0A2A2J9C9_9BILA|nr:hypothetical protein WR25_23931 [Diploscapter pachys]